MPLFDFRKLYGAELAAALRPDERLHAVGPYTEPLAGDESRLGVAGPGPDRLILGFSFLHGLLWNHHRIDRALGGVCGVGGPDSIAVRLWRAAEDCPDNTYYAVTDQRLVLLAWRLPAEFRVVFEVPRSAVAGARRKGKPFQRGRVELRFTDGSMKAFTTGILRTTHARALLKALSLDRLPGR